MDTQRSFRARFSLKSGVPKLDQDLSLFVEESMANEHTLGDMLTNAMDHFKSRSTEPIIVHSACLTSPAMVDQLLLDPETTVMAKIAAGVILFFWRHKGTNITLEDINTIFHDVQGEDLNYSFPPLGNLVGSVRDSESGWPAPYKSKEGILWETCRVAGDMKFPKNCRDTLTAAGSGGWFTPICARIPDENVAAISKMDPA